MDDWWDEDAGKAQQVDAALRILENPNQPVATDLQAIRSLPVNAQPAPDDPDLRTN
jgi:hypothetical protein